MYRSGSESMLVEWNQDNREIYRHDGHTISYTPLSCGGLQLSQRMTLDVGTDISQSKGHHMYSVSVGGLSPGMTYSVQVTAYNSDERSQPSAEAVSGGK